MQRMDKIGPPAGWREDQATARRVSPPPRTPQPVDGEGWDEWDEDYSLAYCTPSRYRSRTAQRRNSRTYRMDDLAAPRPIVYAQYDPAFDPDLQPLPQRRVATTTAARPAPQADDDGELPPGLTPAAWLAMRHVVSVARKVVAVPANVTYVPEESAEEPQLVVTPQGFRMAERFTHLEIRR